MSKFEKKISLSRNSPLVIIAGPCVIESELATLQMAEKLIEITTRHGAQLVFKASFDKANRISIHSYRGPGIKEGLRILAKVKKEFNLPITTDFHEASQAAEVAQVADIIQVPAFLCRQTDLLVAAAKTGKVVNVKKGQFLAPSQMLHCKQKLIESGCSEIIFTERGASFGYQNLVVDMTSIPEMQAMGVPVCFDATHSVQKPGGAGSSSGGRAEMAPLLANAALAMGADLLFCEVHQDPQNAKSDASSQITPEVFNAFLPRWMELHAQASPCHA